MPQAVDDRPGTIVGYYTRGSRYEREAARMWSSLANLGLPVALSAVDDLGSWLANVRRKPHFLAKRRRELAGPMLYVDVDAVIHSNPWPYLRGYEADCAVAGHQDLNLISGTILINDTQGARVFLDKWCADQDAKPDAWDQHSLHDVVMANLQSGQPAFSADFLPPAMCYVFDRTFRPPVTPVVEHLQASREMRAEGGDEQAQLRLESRRRRLSALDAELGLPAPDAGSWPLSGRYGNLKAADRIARTRGLALDRASDVARWSNPENLLPAWSERASLVASLFDPPMVVLDLGCGRMDLERALKAGVLYRPSDTVCRDARTIACDLNKSEIPEVEADAVTMLGVLEYVYEPNTVLGKIAKRWRRLVTTCCPADLDAGRDRAAHGWVNALTSANLAAMAAESGLDLTAILPSSDNRERIYVFDSRIAVT